MSDLKMAASYRCFLSLVALIGVTVCQVAAQTRTNLIYPDLDERGPIELTVCSQNLENYGLYEFVKTRSKIGEGQFYEKEDDLVQRFVSKNCDVIAVQEVLASNELTAQAALNQLAAALTKRSNRQYEAVTGPSNDSFLRQGFLLATDRVELLSRVSYERVELPKLSEQQKPRLFTRGPLEVQLRVLDRAESAPKIIAIINMHFKSKHGGEGDPAELEWEGHRMEMAEALRRIIDKRHSASFAGNGPLLMVVGDRNSHFDSASAKILEGVLTLKKFRDGGNCRLSKRGVPLCKAGSGTPQKLFSVLTSDPQTKLLPGTLRYQNEYSWLDEILMPAEGLPFAWVGARTDGDYDSGVVYQPRLASDHAMVWVRLNW